MSCQSITSSCHVTFKGCNYPHHSDMRPKSLEGRGLVGCLRETAECFSGPEMQRETSESLATGRTVSCYQKSGNKSSAVAEMGDRGHNRHGPKRGGLLCPPLRGGRDFRLTQCGQGLLPYQVASSSIQPFGHNRHGPKTGGCDPFRGGSCDPI